ncbi:MAG: hypothetical protein ABIA76_04450 [Candidatus Diapherotrites archaeon]
MQELTVKSSKRTEFIDVTEKVSGLIKKQKINSGIAVLFVPHTT